METEGYLHFLSERLPQDKLHLNRPSEKDIGNKSPWGRHLAASRFGAVISCFVILSGYPTAASSDRVPSQVAPLGQNDFVCPENCFWAAGKKRKSLENRATN